MRRGYLKWKIDPTRRIRLALTGCESALAVQIGSNDGKTNDPLYPLFEEFRGWRGILVEPQPDAFSKLARLRGEDPRFALENVAIADHAGRARFYRVSAAGRSLFDGAVPWVVQLGTFDPTQIRKHLAGALEHHLEVIEVHCMTLHQLFEKHEVANFDILHIDAEGYDWKILSQLDLSRYTPTVIVFEHAHLNASDFAQALERLRPIYRVERGVDDTICIKRQR